MSPRLLALIPLAVGINLAMGLIVQAVGLPIFLDTIGTVMVAVLAGPAAAVVTGSLSQIVFTLWSGNPMWITYLPLQVAIALFAGFASQRGGFRAKWVTVAGGARRGVRGGNVCWAVCYMGWGGVDVF